jgi:hypothetical protein
MQHYVCQGLAAGRLFSPGTPISSLNKTDRHDIAELLLKLALNTINSNINTSYASEEINITMNIVITLF